MRETDDQTRRLAKIVSHPLRGKIIETLGERGPLGWKELSETLGVETGALYHHLDRLEGLVARDSAKKYSLTKSGRIVYARLSQSHGLESVQKAAADLRREGGAGRVFASVFLPRGAISFLGSDSRKTFLPILLLGLGLVAYCYLTGMGPRLYSIESASSPFEGVGYLAVSIAVLMLISYLGARFGFKANPDFLQLSVGVLVSFLPVFALSSVTLLPSVASFILGWKTPFTIVLVLFQSWSAIVLGAGLSVSSGLRLEKSLVVSLVAIYATMVLMLVEAQVI